MGSLEVLLPLSPSTVNLTRTFLDAHLSLCLQNKLIIVVLLSQNKCTFQILINIAKQKKLDIITVLALLDAKAFLRIFR